MELCKIKNAIETSLMKQRLNNLSIIQFLDKLSNETILHIYKDIVENEVKRVYIFTDGNCKRNGKKNAIAAYCVYSRDDPEFNVLEHVTGRCATNNVAELCGFLHIYKVIYERSLCINENVEFVICADSEYSINCVNNWISKWSKNGWKKTDGKNVLNRDILEKIHEYKQKIFTNPFITIKFKHVNSHRIEPSDKTSMDYYYWRGNDYVDKKINKFLTELQ